VQIEKRPAEISTDSRGVGIAVVGHVLILSESWCVLLRASSTSMVVAPKESACRFSMRSSIISRAWPITTDAATAMTSRIHGHLPPKPPAESGDTDADFFLDKPRAGASANRAHRMRRLGGHVYGELALCGIEVGDAAAGLHRGDVDAGDTTFSLITTSAAASARSASALSPPASESEVVLLASLSLRSTGAPARSDLCG